MKGKSGSGGPIINGIGKALMANFTPSKNGGRNLENFADIFTSKDGSLIPNKHRAFLMDTQVKYTIVSIDHSSTGIICLAFKQDKNAVNCISSVSVALIVVSVADCYTGCLKKSVPPTI